MAHNIMQNLLPAKSKERYNIAYNEFLKWQKLHNVTTISEKVMLIYFSELSEKWKASTLWSHFSMLKSTILINHNLDISKYNNVVIYLKRQSVNYECKKSNVLSPEHIEQFLTNAPDVEYLATKVALIFGICGALRGCELTNLSVDNIEEHVKMFLVKIPITKNNKPRKFVIEGKFYSIVKKYTALRPQQSEIKRFFLNYQHGKCKAQPIGKNKFSSMPKQIANFLKLKDPELYTGHTFRRTSATILADAGANITTIKRHGGWRSDSVAEGYIEESIGNKRKIGNIINSAMNLQPPEIQENI
ncbi:tyrosine recombinase XerC-like [Prorops nasuta]|uniref:tyrosine recombinase XerC-like n=1 Tax=Prorops nasuta TaxID=863751 RepID=UPI0034CD0EAD